MNKGTIMWHQDWVSAAACRQSDPDDLFVLGAEQRNATRVCTGCPVRIECLAEALDNQIEWGVWGGMTERERRALLRRHPSASWRAVLERAANRIDPSTPGSATPRQAADAPAAPPSSAIRIRQRRRATALRTR
jgi:WhiB family transcriptional regulator, redox-sensing transcriptional regulator